MKKSKLIQISINWGGHDTSAALAIDNKIVAAAEQERYDLNKHSKNFPIDAINDCLNISKLKISNVDNIILCTDYEDLINKLYLEPALKDSNRVKFLIKDIDRIKSYVNYKDNVRKQLNFSGKIFSYEHHLCHLASAYYPSGYKKSLILSLDGVGQFETGMVGIGNNGIIKTKNINCDYPHSLGLIYSAITFFLGWKHHCDEGIIMGLAPYGNANKIVPGQSESYIDFFRKIIVRNKISGFKINTDWIAYHIKRDVWVSEKFKSIFGNKRNFNENILDHHKNIAAALQLRLEEIVLSKLRILKKKYKLNYLCVAGGVGLNCSLNGKIMKSKIFKEIFVQPASGDSGLVIGALYLAIQNNYKKKLKIKKRYNHYLGSSFSNNEIEYCLKKNKVSYLKNTNIFKKTAQYLVEGKIVAWFQGKAEFGPRALGNRSILCKPYPAKIKDYLNKNVKFRENFRPYAPAILFDQCKKYFNINQESPHMLVAYEAKKNIINSIPAVVHIDSTCRVQTVTKETNFKFYKLINEFFKLSLCPVVLNTSFNIKGQPIVNHPDEAIKTFKNTKIDKLVIGDFIAIKE